MWTEDRVEVLTFADVLVTADYLDTPRVVVDFFDKPFKWGNEHKLWVGFGRPIDRNRDGWELFAKALEKLS